jgi:hypothetical protein
MKKQKRHPGFVGAWKDPDRVAWEPINPDLHYTGPAVFVTPEGPDQRWVWRITDSKGNTVRSRRHPENKDWAKSTAALAFAEEMGVHTPPGRFRRCAECGDSVPQLKARTWAKPSGEIDKSICFECVPERTFEQIECDGCHKKVPKHKALRFHGNVCAVDGGGFIGGCLVRVPGVKTQLFSPEADPEARGVDVLFRSLVYCKKCCGRIIKDAFKTLADEVDDNGF